MTPVQGFKVSRLGGPLNSPPGTRTAPGFPEGNVIRSPQRVQMLQMAKGETMFALVQDDYDYGCNDDPIPTAPCARCGAGPIPLAPLAIVELESRRPLRRSYARHHCRTIEFALAVIRQTAESDGDGVHIHMEQEPGSAGKFVILTFLRQLAGYVFGGERSTGSKADRALPFAAQAEGGAVKLVRGPWNRDFLDEVEVFPFGRHDDMVDATSAAFAKLVDGCYPFLPMPPAPASIVDQGAAAGVWSPDPWPADRPPSTYLPNDDPDDPDGFRFPRF